MIQGRFDKGYDFLKPTRLAVPFRITKIISVAMIIFSVLKNIFFGRFLNSNFRIHLLDLFIKTTDIDPFDDTKNRYVVVQYKYDEKRKQIVPTRISASSTLRGAQKLAKTHCEISSLPFLNYKEVHKEYIVIRYYRINEDLERSVIRNHFR